MNIPKMLKMNGNYRLGGNNMNSYNKAPNIGKGKLFVASLATIIGLYGILMLLLIIIFEILEIGLDCLLITSVIILFIEFLIAPFSMDLTLNWFYKINWRKKDEIPEYVQKFIEEICREKNIKFPKFGIIEDNSPNAFTYGRGPNSARLVLTKGTILMLSEDELKAVIAHEMGHIIHWDMLLMTVAQLVPVVAYSISKIFLNSQKNRRRSSKSDKAEGITILIGIISYVVYIISEYIVLWFSRIREYYADQFSGEVTGNPNFLASALIKIGFGLKSSEGKTKLNSVSALGICDDKTMKTLGVVSYTNTNPTKLFDEEMLRDISKWDLWNPWATIYEINSTHPLIAKRLKSLSKQAYNMDIQPLYTFEEYKPESYVDDFFKDLFIMFLPFIVFIIGCFLSLIIPGTNPGFGVLITCIIATIFSLIKTKYRYPTKNFDEKRVVELLKEIKVSSVSPVACSIKGNLIGRGTPGYIFSEDFTLEDDTGIIFLDYAQPLNIWNGLFGLLKAEKYIGKEVEVIGWYRRSPVPYIEIKEIVLADKTIKCHSYTAQIILSIVLIIVLAIFGLMML